MTSLAVPSDIDPHSGHFDIVPAAPDIAPPPPRAVRHIVVRVELAAPPPEVRKDYVPRAVVSTEDGSMRECVIATPALRARMPRSGVAFFHAEVDREGEMEIGERAKGWA